MDLLGQATSASDQQHPLRISDNCFGLAALAIPVYRSTGVLKFPACASLVSNLN
jgi:hypothetical protein